MATASSGGGCAAVPARSCCTPQRCKSIRPRTARKPHCTRSGSAASLVCAMCALASSDEGIHCIPNSNGDNDVRLLRRSSSVQTMSLCQSRAVSA
eukprot:16438599-Heterocapsa_arctica.AAC.2